VGPPGLKETIDAAMTAKLRRRNRPDLHPRVSPLPSATFTGPDGLTITDAAGANVTIPAGELRSLQRYLNRILDPRGMDGLRDALGTL
jgi:hypothetical protein